MFIPAKKNGVASPTKDKDVADLTRSQRSASSSPSVAQKANQVYEKHDAKKTDVEFDPRYDKETVKQTQKKPILDPETREHKNEWLTTQGNNQYKKVRCRAYLTLIVDRDTPEWAKEMQRRPEAKCKMAKPRFPRMPAVKIQSA